MSGNNNSEQESKGGESNEGLQKILTHYEHERQVFTKKRMFLQMQLKERNQKLEELEISMSKLQTTVKVYQNFIAKELGPRENKTLKKLSGASYMVPIRKEQMAYAVKQHKSSNKHQ